MSVWNFCVHGSSPKAEIQAETAVRLKQLELEASETGRSAPRGSGMSPPPPAHLKWCLTLVSMWL